MSLIKHCIVDTDTNKVVNIIEYETDKTGNVPDGLEEHLLCVACEHGDIGADYIDGVIVNQPQLEPVMTQGAA
jgi:hypothetical protein